MPRVQIVRNNDLIFTQHKIPYLIIGTLLTSSSLIIVHDSLLNNECADYVENLNKLKNATIFIFRVCLTTLLHTKLCV